MRQKLENLSKGAKISYEFNLQDLPELLKAVLGKTNGKVENITAQFDPNSKQLTITISGLEIANRRYDQLVLKLSNNREGKLEIKEKKEVKVVDNFLFNTILGDINKFLTKNVISLTELQAGDFAGDFSLDEQGNLRAVLTRKK